jgi:hypothetical protein
MGVCRSEGRKSQWNHTYSLTADRFPGQEVLELEACYQPDREPIVREHRLKKRKVIDGVLGYEIPKDWF